MKPRIYNRNLELIGVAQNASEVGYERKFNDLHTATFKLPLDDPKNNLCQVMNIVDIFDGEESKGKYRILDNPETEVTKEGEFLEYSCEHVIAFLLNDPIDGYMEIGGTNMRTRAVIEAVLDKQIVKRWKLGTCDFNRQFQYSWENTNVLEALFSIPKSFDVGYHWTYDTSTYPWTINLVAAETTRSCEIRKKRNMTYIKRSIDSSQLCTRLYCKGYGEGVNQLTIAEVNNGKPYLDDATAQAKYGILASFLIDRRFTDMTHLKAYGQQVLDRLKNPLVTYKANAVDLSRITRYDWDKSDEGKVVHIIEEDRGIDLDATIISVKKADVDGKPLEMEITISNKTSDITSDIESLAQRASINQQYAQGATNLYCQQFADNADATHPAKMKIYVPADCTRINEILLNWNCYAFRAYSKSAAAGGSNTLTSKSGGATTVTSASGGDRTVTSASGGDTTVTSAGGGDTTVTSAGGGDSTQTSADGGGGTSTSGGGGNVSCTIPKMYITTGLDGKTTGPIKNGEYVDNVDTYTGNTAGESSHTHPAKWGHQHTTGSSFKAGDDTGGVKGYSDLNPNTGAGSSHNHNVTHTHNMYHAHKLSSLDLPDISFTLPSHTHSVTISSHTHSITIPSHTHSVTIPSHTHGVTIPSHTHDVTIPSHTHDVTIPDHTHQVVLPDHTHGIVYGIYEGEVASSCTVKVDGNTIPGTAKANTDINIIPYLAKDDGGKITRSTWHTVEIYPDKMSRIEAALFVRAFITSHTGGNY